LGWAIVSFIVEKQVRKVSRQGAQVAETKAKQPQKGSIKHTKKALTA
jgi:hypothetical protein